MTQTNGDASHEFEVEHKYALDIDVLLATSILNILIAGSLGIALASITFLKDIAPHPAYGTLLWLRIAMILLLLTAFLGVASTISSRRAGGFYRKAIHALRNNDVDGANGLMDKCDEQNKTTRLLSHSGLVTLACGVLALAWFANGNLPKEAPLSGIIDTTAATTMK